MIAILLFTDSEAGACRESDIYIDDICFKISIDFVTRFEADCTGLPNGKLATINDDNTFDSIRDALRNVSAALNGYWIGLHLADWAWTDGI